MTASSTHREPLPPLWAALGGAMAISFSAIFFELADVSPQTGAAFRFIYALPLLAILWWRGVDRNRRSPRARILAMVAGVMLGLDVVAWHVAIGDIGTGLATLIANSQVVIVGLLAWVLLGERPSRRLFTAVPIMLIGVALVSGLGRSESYGEDPIRGTLIALVAAFFYAGFLLGYRRSNKVRVPAAGPLFDATLGAAVTTVLLGSVTGTFDSVPIFPAHGWLIALALSTQVVGWLAIGYALPRLPAAETSAVILLQPVATMMWGALLFGERPSLIQLSGAVLVLCGVGLVATASARGQRPQISTILPTSNTRSRGR